MINVRSWLTTVISTALLVGIAKLPRHAIFVILPRSFRAAVRSDAHNKAAPTGGFVKLDVLTGSLFELGGNGGEYAVQRGTDRLHGGDDHDRDARGDKAVFDRGGA